MIVGIVYAENMASLLPENYGIEDYNFHIAVTMLIRVVGFMAGAGFFLAYAINPKET